MPRKGSNGKGGEASPQQRAFAQRNERPVRPENMLTPESSESDKAIYAAELRAFAVELEAWSSLRGGFREASPSDSKKEIKLDLFDGQYDVLSRWRSQLIAAARVRNWHLQLEPDYESEYTTAVADVQRELEGAMAMSFESTALQYYQDAVDAHSRLSELDPRCDFRAAFVFAFVSAAVRLCFRP